MEQLPRSLFIVYCWSVYNKQDRPYGALCPGWFSGWQDKPWKMGCISCVNTSVVGGEAQRFTGILYGGILHYFPGTFRHWVAYLHAKVAAISQPRKFPFACELWIQRALSISKALLPSEGIHLGSISWRKEIALTSSLPALISIIQTLLIWLWLFRRTNFCWNFSRLVVLSSIWRFMVCLSAWTLFTLDTRPQTISIWAPRSLWNIRKRISMDFSQKCI